MQCKKAFISISADNQFHPKRRCCMTAISPYQVQLILLLRDYIFLPIVALSVMWQEGNWRGSDTVVGGSLVTASWKEKSIKFCLLLADLGKARGCCTNTVVIYSLIDSFADPFPPTALRRRQAKTVRYVGRDLRYSKPQRLSLFKK